MTTENPWEEIRTYKDLIHTNMQFVNGILPSSPYHLSPLALDSVPLTNKLIKLHTFGVCTVNGQSSSCTEGFNERTNRYWQIQQKPYVCFFVRKNETTRKLINNLMTNKKLVVIGTDLTQAGHYFHNISDDESYNVTRQRDNEVKQNVKNEEWEYYTNLRPCYPADVCIDDHGAYQYPNLRGIFEQCMYVEVAMKIYCRGDVEQAVIDECQTVGMKQCYRE